MNCPKEYSFALGRGTDRKVRFGLFSVKDGVKTVYDFTGTTAAMQLRRTVGATEAVDSLTTGNGKLLLDTKEGILTVVFTHDATEKYPVTTLVYDIELTNSLGEKFRPIFGKIKVLAEVTRIEPTEM